MKKRLLSDEFKSRYVIESELVSDPSGALVKAWDKGREMTVAIKFISPEILREHGKELIEQANILATAKHENIVQVFEIQAQGKHPYISFEHVEGENLSSMLKGLGAFPIKLSVKWMQSLLSALGHAHGRGLLHGDMTGETTLISTEDVLKVTDFAYVRRREHRSHYTATGIIHGSPAFMAPELALGEKATEASDIYSSAVILFEMLTAALPFAGATAADLLLAHVRVPAPNPSGLRPGIPRELSEIILKGMAKNPRDRYSSCEDFQRALSKLQIEEDEIGKRAKKLRKQSLGPDDSGEHDPESARSTGRMFAITFGAKEGPQRDPEECRSTSKMRPPMAGGQNPPKWEKNLRIRAGSNKVRVTWSTQNEQCFTYSVALSSSNEKVASGEEEQASTEHRLEVEGLSSGSTYVFRIWDEKDYVERKFKTPVGVV